MKNLADLVRDDLEDSSASESDEEQQDSAIEIMA